MSLLEDARAEQETADLRRALTDALRKLDQANLKNAELADAVYRAAADGIAALAIPPVPRPRSDRRKGKPEVAVAMLSDWQLGKRTPNYDSPAAERRVERMAAKVIEMTEIQRAHHPVKHIHVWLLGDLVEGELIFPGQAHRIDASLYRQVTLDGPRILGNFLRRMAASFEAVHVLGVIGNHGAIGGASRREMHPETNADMMLYRIVQQLTADEKRITWRLPDTAGERAWYLIDEIGAYSSLLIHGDQVRGWAGIPWYGFKLKVPQWASGAIEPFGDVACGHFHQKTQMSFPGRRKARINGTLESMNTYAQETLASVSDPSQTLLFVEPSRGIVTAEYDLYLGDI
jgi:hypothetical protein